MGKIAVAAQPKARPVDMNRICLRPASYWIVDASSDPRDTPDEPLYSLGELFRY